MLAERKIDLSLYSGDDPSPDLGQKQLKPNEQNVTNRTLEIRYADHIKRCVEYPSFVVGSVLTTPPGHRKRKKHGSASAIITTHT